MARRERRKLDAPAGEERVTADEQGVGSLAREGGEGRFDLTAGAGVEELKLQSEGTCRTRYVAQRGLGGRGIGRIDQHGNANRLGDQVVQKPKPLGGGLLCEKIDAGRIAARPCQPRAKSEPRRTFP